MWSLVLLFATCEMMTLCACGTLPFLEISKNVSAVFVGLLLYYKCSQKCVSGAT